MSVKDLMSSNCTPGHTKIRHRQKGWGVRNGVYQFDDALKASRVIGSFSVLEFWLPSAFEWHQRALCSEDFFEGIESRL
jgi:hypothetical protein